MENINLGRHKLQKGKTQEGQQGRGAAGTRLQELQEPSITILTSACVVNKIPGTLQEVVSPLTQPVCLNPS